MKKILPLALLLIAAAACNKDKFQTTPLLKLVSVPKDVIGVNEDFRITLKYTDKEGDISNMIKVRKTRLNVRKVETIYDSLEFSIPQFPTEQQGEIELVIPYQFGLLSAKEPVRENPGEPEPRYESDTLRMSFYIVDKAEHASDSVVVEPIVVKRS